VSIQQTSFVHFLRRKKVIQILIRIKSWTRGGFVLKLLVESRLVKKGFNRFRGKNEEEIGLPIYLK